MTNPTTATPKKNGEIVNQNLKDWITIWIPSIILFLLGVLFLVYKNKPVPEPIKPIQCDSWYILSGDNCVLSYKAPVQIDDIKIPTWTGEIIDKDKTPYEQFEYLVSIGNAFVFDKIPHQPVTTTANCSASLSEYIRKNNFEFTPPKNIKKAYLYIRFIDNLPTVTKPPVFLYFHNTTNSWYPISWYPIPEKSLPVSQDWEYLFDIGNIPLVAFYNKQETSFNWLEQFSNPWNQFIAWFVRECDRSTIQNITIAWE